MTLWVILALMTAAAVFAVLWPLSRKPGTQRSGSDVAVYEDQLTELARDRKLNLIGPAEAEAARVEIARRLLAAADSGRAEGDPRSAQWRRRAALLVVLATLPLGAAVLYLNLGSPQLPAAPLAARQDAPPQERTIAGLVSHVEAHLQRNPEDGRGWEVLAPVYLRLGRYDDAVKAWGQVLRLSGSNPTREADFGEAITAAANGVVTVDAKAAFQRALAHDPGEVKARYFIGLAAEQEGRGEEAATIWRALIATAPAGAPWQELVRSSLARVDPTAAASLPALSLLPLSDQASAPNPHETKAAPEAAAATSPHGPSAADLAAAEKIAPEDRSAMVRGMVDRLASRLKQDGSDVEGWLRLMRAYSVMGDAAKAKEAAAEARQALAPDDDKLRKINELVKTLGLEG